MNFFSIVSDWFTRLSAVFAASGSHKFVKTLAEVESLAARAIPTVAWIGDVVVTAIQHSHLPTADILAVELKKFAPHVPDIEKQAGRLAVKDRADMLLSLAVLILQYSGAGSVKLSILRAAIEIAHLVYSSEKAK